MAFRVGNTIAESKHSPILKAKKCYTDQFSGWNDGLTIQSVPDAVVLFIPSRTIVDRLNEIRKASSFRVLLGICTFDVR
jgi:hypothetical protein